VRGWNYIAGTMMLMFGVIFLMIFIRNSSFGVLYANFETNKLLVAISILPVSLLVSFVAAWWVARQNDQPVLR